ncbi:MAG: hypothetical protein SGI83_16615 [Bacteroidota bacterium]|nr:hypothetical protein [Bacteroidota bacterium]
MKKLIFLIVILTVIGCADKIPSTKEVVVNDYLEILLREMKSKKCSALYNWQRFAIVHQKRCWGNINP